MKQNDLNQIKDVFNEVVREQFPGFFREQFSVLFRENFNASFAQIWEHNLEPSLMGLNNRLDKVENRLGMVEGKLTKIDSNYVTKAYLDDKLGGFKAEVGLKLSRLENKTARLTTLLHNKKVFSKSELEEINSI